MPMPRKYSWVIAAIIFGGIVGLEAQSSLSTTYTTADAWDCAGGASCAKSIGILDGRNKAFTLRAAPTGPAAVDVYLNGIRERIGADYSLTGNSNQILTFTNAPAVDDTVDVRYRENVRANVLPQ